MQWGWQWRWRVKSREPTQVPFPHKMTWVASFFQVLRKKSEATILQPEIKVTRLWGAGDATQNGWIFGKVLKGGGHFQSKNLCCRFCTFKQAFFWTLSEKNCNIIFWKWGGGVTCCWKFSEKSSILVASPVPENDRSPHIVLSHFVAWPLMVQLITQYLYQTQVVSLPCFVQSTTHSLLFRL